MTLLGLLSGLFILVAIAAFCAAATVGQRRPPNVLPTRRSLRIMFLVAMATGLGLMGSAALLQGWAGVLRDWGPLLPGSSGSPSSGLPHTPLAGTLACRCPRTPRGLCPPPMGLS
jgi:hypothetical protein